MPAFLLSRPAPRAPIGAALGAAVAGAVCAAFALAPLPAAAQFKTVGPDGKVTYSDRQPSAAEGQTSALGARAAAQAAAEPDLPFELRQIAQRYPVTLYTLASACDPCASARQLLKARGIPFAERQVVSGEDADALERLTGARDAPTLTIGSQMLRGLVAEQWTQYLDAAGYPRESRLPASYQYRSPVPIVDRPDASRARGATAGAPVAAPQATAPAAPSPAGSGGIRF